MKKQERVGQGIEEKLEAMETEEGERRKEEKEENGRGDEGGQMVGASQGASQDIADSLVKGYGVFSGVDGLLDAARK